MSWIVIYLRAVPSKCPNGFALARAVTLSAIRGHGPLPSRDSTGGQSTVSIRPRQLLNSRPRAPLRRTLCAGQGDNRRGVDSRNRWRGVHGALQAVLAEHVLGPLQLIGGGPALEEYHLAGGRQ